MRRKWIVFTAVAVLAVAGVVWVLVPRSPFAFLDGREATKTVAEGTFYSFRADFDDLLKRAEPELKAAGLEEVEQPGSSKFRVFAEPVREGATLKESLEVRSVVFSPATRLIVPLDEIGKNPGWVTVSVHGRFTSWQRIMRSLGFREQHASYRLAVSR